MQDNKEADYKIIVVAADALFYEQYFIKIGALSLSKGEKLLFDYKTFRTKLYIKTESGVELAFVEHKGLFKSRFLVHYNEGISVFDNYPWILPFGCDYYIKSRRQS